MAIQFREIDTVIDYIDASDIETLSALMELIQYLKNFEIELDELLGE